MCVICDIAKVEPAFPPCRSSVNRTASNLGDAKECVQQAVTPSVNTSPFAPNVTTGNIQGIIVGGKTAQATPKQPYNLHQTSVTVEPMVKPKVKARLLNIGQALRAQSGNTICRIAPDVWFVLTPYNVTVHYSAETLPPWEGELLPLGSTISIKL